MATRESKEKDSDDAKYPPQTARRIKSAVVPTIILVVAATIYLAIRSHQGVAPDPTAHAGVGESLVFLEIEPLTGNPPPVTLEGLQDRVTLLNFWGWWCPPCRAELPHLAQLRQRFAGHPAFQLLAVSCPAGGQTNDLHSLREETAKLLKRMQLDMPTYFDPDNATLGMMRDRVQFEGFPTTLLLDRRGEVRAVWVGYRPGVEIEMEQHIGAILNEER